MSGWVIRPGSIFHGSDNHEQKERPEREPGDTGHAARARVDTFLQNWLTRRTGDPIPAKHLYDRFLKYAVSRDLHGSITNTKDVEELMSDIRNDAKNFRLIEAPAGTKRFDQFLKRTALMDVVVFYPVILELMSRPSTDAADLDASAAIIESYLVRRMVCAQQTRGYGTLAITLLAALREDATPAAPILEQVLSGLSKALRWPDDNLFEKHWCDRPIYGSLRQQRIVMLLSAIEEYYQSGGSKSEPIVKFNFDNLQIEHIMPRGWREHWPLGVESDSERDIKLDTIGNLTLVTGHLNPTLSNAPWIASQGENQKRNALSEHSRLQLNSRLVHKHIIAGDEACISMRAKELFEVARLIWVAPDPSYLREEPSPEKRERLTSKNSAGELRRIKLLVDGNPKRNGSASYKRFSLYRDGQTIDEYKVACEAAGFTSFQARADLRWDSDHGFIELVGITTSKASEGDINPNAQRLVRKTTEKGADHNQYVWVVECGHCHHEYGANGSDFHHRKCPECQNGAAGISFGSTA